MTINPHLAALHELGQSVWYDNLSKDVLGSGELKELIHSGVRGLTSNPTIFKKAIADTSHYDEDLSALKGRSAEQICDELMLRDVAAAADLLREVYDQSGERDGFASIEVSPLLAYDTEQTLNEARRIWEQLARPNILIKVPATKQGLPAIETLLSEGINVNITLIFSVERYREVAEAFLSALEARKAAGQPLESVASVASFFVSRVDTICEKAFDASGGESSRKSEFIGKVGIANSKLAYAAYGELFRSERFASLVESGAQPQRPLWASTSTKNPDFSPLLYVEELAGPDTVNTMPPQTLAALMEKASIEPRLEHEVDRARELINGLDQFGLDLPSLLTELESAGVQAFVDSYQDLLAAIETKMADL